MPSEATRRAVLGMLDKHLLSLVMRRDLPSIILMEPEYLRRTRRNISFHAGPPLQYGKPLRSPILLQHWPEQRVHASRYPCLLAVVEGEIDWRIGVTQPSAPTREAGQAHSDYLTVPLTAGTFFLTPAGVPYSDGHDVHWERPTPRTGQAVVFWMIIFPSGFMCHYCRSTATEHHSHHNFFVLCPPIYQLTRMLEKELADGQSSGSAIIHAHLQAILSYARRAVKQQVEIMPLGPGASSQNTARVGPDLGQDALQRACAYIEAHLQEPLSPASVAAHAYLSTRHLERYFQRELGMTMTDYIIQRRVEAAKVLLQDTDLLIRQVGEMVGYRNQSSFTQVFKRHTGISPRACRNKEVQSPNNQKSP